MKIVSPKDMSEMIRENEGNMGSHDVFYIIPLGHWLNHIPQNELIPFGKLDDCPCRKRKPPTCRRPLDGTRIEIPWKTKILSISKAPESEIVL